MTVKGVTRRCRGIRNEKKSKTGIYENITTGLNCMLILLSAVASHCQSLQEEFDSLCIHTQEAENLSVEELQELVTECDHLQKNLQKLMMKKRKSFCSA